MTIHWQISKLDTSINSVVRSLRKCPSVKRSGRYLWRSAHASLLLSLPLTLLADADAASPLRGPRTSVLEEIVVTAQKRNESIRDIPIALHAFTSDTLHELGIVDTRDLANFIPGFSYASSGFDNPIYTLRGIGFNDSSRTANSAVGVYVDEVPIPYPYMTQGADVDLKRVEVLKGPQGTLYGRNTTGGAINYIAEKPTDSLEFGIEAEYGRFEEYSLEGYVSGSLTERVKARLALRQIQADEGWQISLTRLDDRLGKKDKQAGRATLEWGPADSLQLDLTLDWWSDRSEPQAPQPIGIDPQNRNLSTDQVHPDVRNHPIVQSEDNRLADWVGGFPWTLDNTFRMPALRVKWDITDRETISLIAAYIDFETDEARIPQSGLSSPNQETKERNTDAWAQSVELRADGRLLDESLFWLVGIYASKDFVDDFRQSWVATNSGVFNIQPGVTPIIDSNLSIGEQKATSNALFANVEYAIAPYLGLTLGMRYTDESRRFSGCAAADPENNGMAGLTPLFNARSQLEGGSGGAGPGDCLTLDQNSRNPSLIQKKLEEDNFGGRAVLTWRPNEAHLFYGSYSRGFKSGSFPTLQASEGKQYDPVTQERLDALELGGKTSWFDETLRVDFSVFHYDYKDKQLLSFFIDPVFGTLPKLFNVPESRVRGAEIEIQSSPLDGLFVSLSASYLDTKISQFVGVTSEAEEGVDFSGNRLPYAPAQSITLLANYRVPLPFLERLEGVVGADYSYNSHTSSEIEKNAQFNIPTYRLLGAHVGIGGAAGRWSITAWIRNATDEFYQLSVPQIAGDSMVRYTGMPRTYGLRAAYHYR